MSDDQEPVGSVGEEAAKLFAALQGWAKDHGDEFSGAREAAAAGAATAFSDINEHIATGGQDCAYCPICRVISGVRSTSPEVRQHLASAATSLVQALATAMATDVPEREAPRHDPEPPDAEPGDPRS